MSNAQERKQALVEHKSLLNNNVINDLTLSKRSHLNH
ncbi:hypothetical protein SNOG_09860 [Parastagonospora nodorum SN15]|uniref:Uncharacterized protein n=1 Tax=Phaeosphaeria nodorum (strain SN15 / ATCC MYA-4574 / FGSC 10173) TaxID=321614 RepID=Q0UEF4_PHANO|nr:hypothetical protein SNOG_09860 [Parastagonospora nodorum SN15]EAT83125.1 hypothetical protein SNOG_09860 [Parastagonospora nodorum SN15]